MVRDLPFMVSIGFNLERLGTTAARHWRIATCLAALVTIAALFGLLRVDFDDDLRNVLSGETPVFETFDAFRERFADPELEMLVLVEGPLLGSPSATAALSDLHFELQLTEGVEHVFSMFSLRGPPTDAGDAPPLIGFGRRVDEALLRAVRDHPTLGGMTLSEDGQTALFVLSLAPEFHKSKALGELVAELRRLVETTLQGTGASYTLTGFPVVRADIITLIIRDQVVLNSIGALVGFLLSLIIFRSLVAAIITAVPPVVAALWLIGGLGLLGVPITVMSNVLPTLVMMLAYSNSMHLTHAWCRRRVAGDDPQTAAIGAMREIGPATVLTTLTTLIAFLALALADLLIVRNFALTGAAAVAIALLALLILHPLTAIALGARWRRSRTGEISLMDRHAWIATGLVAIGMRRPWTISAVGLALAVLFGLLHLSVPPQHSFREHLSASHPANAAFGRADDTFSGMLPVHVVVPLGAGETPLSPGTLERLDVIDKAVTGLPETGRTFSLRNLVEWAGIRDLENAADVLAPHLEQLTPVERGRLIADDASAVVLTTYLSDQPSWRLRPLIEQIEAVAQAAAGERVSLTGVTVVTALETERGIANLMTNLGLAILVTLGLIAFAFRRIDHGLLSLLPNVLPIVTTGALLYLTGRGMQYTSVIALTVAFGVAVDDTIHFLNRLRLAAGEGRGLADSVTEAGRRVGNVLILTTVVLACGLASTGLSELPTVQLFGILCIVTLVAALASDLLLLPALIMGPARRWLVRDRHLDSVRTSFDASRQHPPSG